MLFGEFIRQLESDGAAAEALVAMGDVVLFASVLDAGATHDESPGEYVANGVKRFSTQASAEDWMRVMRALERGDGDKGRAEALSIMVRWAVDADRAEASPAPAMEPAHDGCTCGGGGGGCVGHAH
jgi:alkylation response protein AidB-like acyl-CoA dehydrogenase